MDDWLGIWENNSLGLRNPEAINLNDGHNSRDNKGRRNEILLFRTTEVRTSGAAENKRRGNDTRQHSQRVLQAEQHTQSKWHLIIESKEGGLIRALLHKGEVRPEQKTIVIVANEAIASSERSNCVSESTFDSLAEAARAHILGGDGAWADIFIHDG